MALRSNQRLRDDGAYRAGWNESAHRHARAFGELTERMVREIQLHRRLSEVPSDVVEGYNRGLSDAVVCINRILLERKEELLANEIKKAREGRVDIPPLEP